MSLQEQITKFSAAILFLLAILMQPVHQLEHIAHGHSYAEDIQTGTSFHNSHETHCNLCDFNFTPTLVLTINSIEIPVEFISIELKKESKISGFFTNEFQSNKQLRAPPCFV